MFLFHEYDLFWAFMIISYQALFLS
nr:NADH-plastoquinone oxidoreductase subunit 3 [Phalaenopsis stobartiana]WKY96293.1 NADH-plastoquinone oxidoreductase subunit 3 [Phalaenopsis wilsonii]